MTTLLFFLASTDLLSWLIPLVCVGCLGGGGVAGALVYRSYRNKQVGTTQEQVSAMLDVAKEEAKTLKKEAIAEAREETQKLKNEQERQFRERNSELQKQENRMHQKEEALDKKEEMFLKKLDQIDVQQKQITEKQQDLSRRQQELEKSEEKKRLELERVAALTREEAKQMLVDMMVSDARKDAAGLVRKFETEAKENG